jgi:Na+-driven multidrug efflux pump
MKISLPAILGMFASFSMQVINTAFCGHLGDQEIMAGVGMATMYSNIFCNSLMMGLNSTLDTLLS